jgi:hypothetical protein
MDPIGFWVGCSLGQVRGSMGLTDFTDTSTTGLILATDTMDRCLITGRNGSITFKGTRRGTGEGMQARRRTMGAVNTRCLDFTVAAVAMAVAVAGDITRAGSYSSWPQKAQPGRHPWWY